MSICVHARNHARVRRTSFAHARSCVSLGSSTPMVSRQLNCAASARFETNCVRAYLVHAHHCHAARMRTDADLRAHKHTHSRGGSTGAAGLQPIQRRNAHNSRVMASCGDMLLMSSAHALVVVCVVNALRNRWSASGMQKRADSPVAETAFSRDRAHMIRGRV